MAPDASDRRENPRYSCEATFLGKIRPDKTVQVRILDVSRAGARLVIPDEVGIGDEFILKWAGDDYSHFDDARGVVRHVVRLNDGRFSIGCEFVEPDRE